MVSFSSFSVFDSGHFLLTNLLMDLLTAAKPSRIVTVSSYAHRKGEINFDDINMEKDFGSLKSYRRSKLANVLFSNELGRRLQGTLLIASQII
jgi:retinol dehydrogenase-12